jgi:hypothetical protein
MPTGFPGMSALGSSVNRVNSPSSRSDSLAKIVQLPYTNTSIPVTVTAQNVTRRSGQLLLETRRSGQLLLETRRRRMSRIMLLMTVAAVMAVMVVASAAPAFAANAKGKAYGWGANDCWGINGEDPHDCGFHGHPR